MSKGSNAKTNLGPLVSTIASKDPHSQWSIAIRLAVDRVRYTSPESFLYLGDAEGIERLWVYNLYSVDPLTDHQRDASRGWCRSGWQQRQCIVGVLWEPREVEQPV